MKIIRLPQKTFVFLRVKYSNCNEYEYFRIK